MNVRILGICMFLLALEALFGFGAVITLKEKSQVSGTLLSITTGSVHIDPEGAETMILVWEADITTFFVPELQRVVPIPVSLTTLPEELKSLYSENIPTVTPESTVSSQHPSISQPAILATPTSNNTPVHHTSDYAVNLLEDLGFYGKGPAK